ncbi:hypothetical protein DF188_08055 [Aliarcobacter skirrowii]|uniref:TerB family tellurite resistance protein n=1 Tax=Aliarcobacter skirrowii TaxID=28200 RepID=A0A2U2BZI3_9BACT|nr:hypothetical protein [Aliarcobacter skirrowii]PWE20413.1 hypothetical protein DF188_08055 [Aliarcobacter skirrowii]
MSLNEQMKDYFSKNEFKKIFDDEIKFKMILNLNEDTYSYLTNIKNLEKFSASLAAGLATAATGYFAWLASLGFGSKILLAVGLTSNPVGWIALAGISGAALMYGGKTLINKVDKNAYDKIPKFLNTPLDYLGQNLINILLPSAIKLSLHNGMLSKDNENILINEFSKFGYNKDFLISEINGILKIINNIDIKDTKNKLEVICKEVKGLKYNSIRNLSVNLFQDIYKNSNNPELLKEYTEIIKEL